MCEAFTLLSVQDAKRVKQKKAFQGHHSDVLDTVWPYKSDLVLRVHHWTKQCSWHKDIQH